MMNLRYPTAFTRVLSVVPGFGTFLRLLCGLLVAIKSKTAAILVVA